MEISDFVSRFDLDEQSGKADFMHETDKAVVIYSAAGQSDAKLVTIYRGALDELCRLEGMPTKRDGERVLQFDEQNELYAEFIVADQRTDAIARLRLFYGQNGAENGEQDDTASYHATLLLQPGNHNVRVDARTDVGKQIEKIIAHLRQPKKKKFSTRQMRIAAAQDEHNPANY